jgi:hypothetical protein
MITSDAFDVEDEQLHSSSDVVIQFVSDQPSTSNPTHTSTNSQPSLSSLAIQPITPSKPNIPSPPTLFLDSTILADVCENIGQELISFIQARNDLIHKDSYEKLWKRLKERVDFVMSELQRTCMDDQASAQQKLQDWLKGVDSNLQQVKILRTWVQNPPSIKGREVTDFIPTGVHPRDLDLTFLSKINFKSAFTELGLLQKNADLEKENKKLKKELMEQKLLLLVYKSSTEAKLEEARVREKNLIRSNEDFKIEMKQQQEAMEKQQEETNMMLKQMIEMFNKQDNQANPLLHTF